MTKKEIALEGVFDGLRLFPLSLAVGVCSGLGFGGGVLCMGACTVFGAVFGCSFLPQWWTLLPVFCVTFRFGAAAGGAASALAGVFAFFLSLMPDSLRGRLSHPAAAAGLVPAMAFLTTALQTNDYFGIGAVGGTLQEILADYVSRGFHPNWRGILYGTIAMVILITYPRKFKRLSQKISAPFAAVLVTFLLHLCLVPDAVHSPVGETGAFAWRSIASGSLLTGVSGSVLQIVLAALSLALLLTAPLSASDSRKLSPALLVCGAAGGAPFAMAAVRRPRLCVLIGGAVAAALFLCPGLSRMPVPTLAVILIVTAWQSLDHAAVKAAFTSGKTGIVLFFCGLLLPLALGVEIAVPLLSAVSLLVPRPKTES